MYNAIIDLQYAYCDICGAIRELEYLSQYGNETEKKRCSELLSSLDVSAFVNTMDTFKQLCNIYDAEDTARQTEKKQKEMRDLTDTWENMVEVYGADADYLAINDHKAIKAERRKSRKAKLKKTERSNNYSVNNCIGKYASSYGKKMLHKAKRKPLELSASDYYKHDSYSYSSLLWALT